MKPERLYIVYRILIHGGVMFTAATYVPYVRHLGVTLAEVDLLNALFQMAIFAFEIPTGLFADRRGRKFSLMCGAVCMALSGVAYACAIGFWTALVAELLAGVAVSFFSGAEEAWLKSAMLRAHGEEKCMEAFQETEAITDRYARFAAAVSGFAGTALSVRLGMGFPYLCEAICCLLAGLLVWRLFAGHGETDAWHAKEAEKRTHWEQLKQALEHIRTRPAIRHAMWPSVIVGLQKPAFYVWPLFFTTLGGLESAGWIWVAMQAVMVGAATVAQRTTKFARPALLGALACMIVGLQFTHLHSLGGALALWMVFEFGAGLARALERRVYMQEVPASDAATFGSIRSFVSSVGATVILGTLWFVFRHQPSDVHAMQIKLSACSAFMLAGTLVWWRSWPAKVTPLTFSTP